MAVEGVSKCAQRAAKPSNVHNRRCSDLWTQTVGGRYNHANRPRERSNNYLMLILFDLSRGRYTMCVRHPQVSFAVRSLHQRLRMVGRLRRPILNFDTPSTIRLNKLLIFNALCPIMGVKTRRDTSLQHQCCHFDTPFSRGF